MNKLPILPTNHQTVKPHTFLPVLRIFTTVKRALQINSFYAKQSQFPKSQMNVTPYNTTAYENKSNWKLGENKPNTNPIKPNFKLGNVSLGNYYPSFGLGLAGPNHINEIRIKKAPARNKTTR